MTETLDRSAAPCLPITALGFLVSRRSCERMVPGNATADPLLINLSGAVHVIVGMVVLVKHPGWSCFAEAMVTFPGVAAVMKGGALIAVPELTLISPKTVGTTLTLSAARLAVSAGILLWIGGFD